MASELGLIYAAGRHWTGSMIELGYNANLGKEKYNRNFLPREYRTETSNFPSLNYSFSERNFYRGDLNNLLTLDLTRSYILEGLQAINKSTLKSTSSPIFETDGHGILIQSDSSESRNTTTGNRQCIFDLVNNEAGISHSLTNLLPTNFQSSSAKNIIFDKSTNIRFDRDSDNNLSIGKTMDKNTTTHDKMKIEKISEENKYFSFVDSLCLEGYGVLHLRSELKLLSASQYIQKRTRNRFPSDSSINELVTYSSDSTIGKINEINFEDKIAVSSGTKIEHGLSSTEKCLETENIAASFPLKSIQQPIILSKSLQCVRSDDFDETNKVSIGDNQTMDGNKQLPEIAYQRNVTSIEADIPKPPLTFVLEHDLIDTNENARDSVTHIRENANMEFITHSVSEIDHLNEIVNASLFTSSPDFVETIQDDISFKISMVKQKKSVRFADELGEELFEEKIISDQFMPPLLQRNRLDSFDDDYRDLGEESPFPRLASLSSRRNGGYHYQTSASLPPIPSGSLIASPNGSAANLLSSTNQVMEVDTSFSWRLTFTQPAAQYLAFRQRLVTNHVSLENVSISPLKNDSASIVLYGTIKVDNIAFEKHVKLRVTTDDWKSFKDYPATHSAELSHASGTSIPFDTFIFNFTINYSPCSNSSALSQSSPISEIQFAVCYQAGKDSSVGEFWDNNDGCNYVLKRKIQNDFSSISTLSYGYKSISEAQGEQTDSQPTCDSTSQPTEMPKNASHETKPLVPYTRDFRPNFEGFSSLTHYSSWKHYSSESMYY